MIESLLCLSLNGFFEARGEPLQGQIAVHEVVINRVENPKFPDTICGVVLQENENGVCQFSWWCDLISNIPNEPNSFNTSKALARLMIEEGDYISVIGSEATHYHAITIDPPYWTIGMDEIGVIGNHIFYKERSKEDVTPLSRPANLFD
tara:strand:- start:44 stop:490 length:447 start_codon:yes stop_codon:yes gene_type:complete